MGDDFRQRSQFLGINHVGSMNNHIRHSLENCLHYATLRKRFPWSNCVGCVYKRKRLAGTDCVGSTCDRKQFRRIIVFFSSTVRISVFERSPVAHDLILSSVCARRAYPRWFLGHVGRTPNHCHSLGDGSKCHREKGLKTVCIAPTRTRLECWACA